MHVREQIDFVDSYIIGYDMIWYDDEEQGSIWKQAAWKLYFCICISVFLYVCILFTGFHPGIVNMPFLLEASINQLDAAQEEIVANQ